MSEETKVLAEVIGNAPFDSTWSITSDSWQEIKTLFKDFITEQQARWQLRITEDNRAFLRRAIECIDLGNATVHMDLTTLNGEQLFYSYDAMSVIGIDKDYFRKLDLHDLSDTLEIWLE